jgi:hypothetical protein
MHVKSSDQYVPYTCLIGSLGLIFVFPIYLCLETSSIYPIYVGADKSLAFPICSTAKIISLGWVKEVRTKKS